MDKYSINGNGLTLKGINIQGLRVSNSRNKSRHDSQYIPINIQPKSMHRVKIRVNNSSRKSSIVKIETQDDNDKFPKIGDGEQKLSKTAQTQKFSHSIVSSDGQVQERIVKKEIYFIKKRQEILSQDGYKKINLLKVKKCTCGNCEQCYKDFSYFLHIFSNDQSVPDITAKSWCIWKKGKNNKFMYFYGRRVHKVREIASLTKIVTSMTAIDYLNKFDLNPDQITYQIRKSSLMVGGTSANLEQGQVYTITQLLYALMLPSGNDAAIALSQVIGLLHNLKVKNKKFNPYQKNWYEQFLTNPNKSFSYIFINLMNEKCQKVGLIDTHFYNSHGNDAFDQLKNVSTCNQIAKISCQYMLKYDFLRLIVNTKNFKVNRYQKSWENTNKLLQDGFQGIKTGITQTAGPCLSAFYKDLVVVVLNSKSMNQRWIEVKKLVRWIIRKGL